MRIPKRLARLFDRIVAWSEVAARIWADYWLLIIGSLLVIGSVGLKWVQFPFTHNLSGLKLSLIRDPGITPHISIFAAGTLGLLLLLVALLFWRRNATLLALTFGAVHLYW